MGTLFSEWFIMSPWQEFDMDESSQIFDIFFGICLIVLNFESHIKAMLSMDSQSGYRFSKFTGENPIKGLSLH
jgi:hypothetical protein